MSQAVESLTYATPGNSRGSPVVAGVWIMIGGLILVFFGGCFCIGIMAVTSPGVLGFGTTTSHQLAIDERVFTVAMYLCATTCFVGGGFTLSLGLRKLLAVGR